MISAAPLRIIDSSRAGSPLIHRAAMEYAIVKKKDINLIRDVGKNITEQHVDIAVFNSASIPPALKKKRQIILENEVLFICVNKTNKLANLSTQQAAEILFEPRPQWSRFTGGYARTIHRFNLHKSHHLAGFDSYILGVPCATEIKSLLTSEDISSVVGVNPDAIGFCGKTPTDNNVKILSVNGVLPTPENISSGSYPLVAKYVVVIISDSPEVKAFLDILLSTPNPL